MRVVSVIMPRQGQSVESCIITKWHKQVGDSVSQGEVLFSYETDKAAFDEEAKNDGILLQIIRQEGDDVPCLEPVCVMGEAGESVASPNGGPEEEGTPTESMGNEPPQAGVTQAAAALLQMEHGGIKISPRARALAKKSGADLSFVTASGPDGRVIARDVQALIDAGQMITKAAQGFVSGGVSGTGLGGRVSLRDLAAKPEAPHSAPKKESANVPAQPVAPPLAATIPEGFAPSYHDEPLPNIRKRIAAAMYASVSSTAQLTHSASFDATNILAYRKQCKEQGKPYGMDGVTLGDLVIYGVVHTLTQPAHAHLNAHFFNDSIRYFDDVHLGIAVDTPRGLMVPTIRYANKKTLLEISKEVKSLSTACRSGAIDPDLLSGASFTVSNLGAYEIEQFTPIINPPQTGILGVCTISQRVREKEGKLEMYPVMTLSLTYDHRALDGAPASAFLRDIKRNMENIQLLLGGGAYDV